MSSTSSFQPVNNSRRDDVDQLVDQYLAYEEAYNPISHSRKARRKRKPRLNPAAHKSNPSQEAAQLADELDRREGGFQFTYRPARYEEGFLIDSVQPFFHQHLISDVVAAVKGGKEASVYRCRAAAKEETTWLAAKVYRPRMFRNLRNDAQYRQGRQTLTADGQVVKKNQHRVMRAIGKKSSFGVQVAHTSWLMYEYTTLQKLHAAGAAVPRPVAAAENAILMDFIGDAALPAPALNEISLDREEAGRLFAEVLRNLELMLQLNLIHGDLSSYNILYWRGAISIIDFPQVTMLRQENGGIQSNARSLLERDIQRVCEYFQQQGIDSDPQDLLRTYWDRYAYENPEIMLADLSRNDPGEEPDNE